MCLGQKTGYNRVQVWGNYREDCVYHQKIRSYSDDWDCLHSKAYPNDILQHNPWLPGCRDRQDRESLWGVDRKYKSRSLQMLYDPWLLYLTLQKCGDPSLENSLAFGAFQNISHTEKALPLRHQPATQKPPEEAISKPSIIPRQKRRIHLLFRWPKNKVPQTSHQIPNWALYL